MLPLRPVVFDRLWLSDAKPNADRPQRDYENGPKQLSSPRCSKPKGAGDDCNDPSSRWECKRTDVVCGVRVELEAVEAGDDIGIRRGAVGPDGGRGRSRRGQTDHGGSARGLRIGRAHAGGELL